MYSTRKIFTGVLLLIITIALLNTTNIPQTIVNDNETRSLNGEIPINAFNENITGSGNDYNVSLHQSYFNDTDIGMNNTNNVLTVDLPTDPTFNSSYTEIKIKSIVAYNDTIIEDVGWELQTSSGAGYATPYLSSFVIPDTCLLRNITINGTLSGASGLSFKIYNSTWNGTHSIPGGSADQNITGWTTTPSAGSGNFWLEYDPSYLLNTSNTQNNTFFLGMQPIGQFSSFKFGLNTTSNKQYNYGWNTGTSKFDEILNQDYIFNISISPLNHTGLPSDYGFTVNGTSITDTSQQEGQWNSSEIYNNTNENVAFAIEPSKWKNISWSVDYHFINFTKTDIITTPTFTVTNGSDVWWNNSFTIDQFDERFNFSYINASIESKWSLQGIYHNNSDWLTNYDNDGKGTITIYSKNGTYDILLTSNNLCSGLKIIKDANERSYLYTNDTNLIIQSNFTESISGNVNISIYNQTDDLMYSQIKAISGTTLDFDPWTVADNIITNGTYKFQVYWYNQTDAGVYLRNISIVHPTSIQWMPISEYSEISNSSEPFNISFYWIDTFNNLNVSTIAAYKLDGDSTENFNSTETDNLYNITIDPNSLALGQHQVEITLEKWGYQNQTYTFIFFIVGTSDWDNDTTNTQLSVNRGVNATFSFRYINTTTEPASNVSDAIIQAISIHQNFTWSYQNVNDGNYTIFMNTSQIDVGIYECRFNVSKTGIPTINITFSVEVKNVSTSLTLIYRNETIIRRNNENLTVIVYYKDEINNVGIDTVSGTNTTVHYENGTLFGTYGNDYSFISTNGTAGYYTFEIYMKFRLSGNYSLYVSLNNLPNFLEATSQTFSFWYIGNTTNITLEEIKYSGNQQIQTQEDRYAIYRNNTIKIVLRLYDSDQSNILIQDTGARFTIKYGTSYLPITSSYQPLITGYEIDVNLNQLELGNTTLVIESSLNNYENQTFLLNITIIPKIQVRITTIEKPSEITEGKSFQIKIKLEFRISESSDWQPLSNKQIKAITIPETGMTTANTNQEGIADFTFTFPLGKDISQGFKITFLFDGGYDLEEKSYELEPFVVQATPITGIDIRYLYYAGAALVFVGAVVMYKRKVVDVKRADRMKILINSTNMIEDALNIQHLLIIYKNTGVTLFFKTFGQESFDPNLISGFLTAIQSFGSEIEIKDTISEMKYKEKVLLFGEGELIRVALVLNSEPSDQLKTNLNLFVETFEIKNDAKLKKWRGQLNEFKDSDTIIDEFLNTWVILPHTLNPDQTILKQVKSSTGKALINAARKLIEESGRDMFFISSLLNACVEEEKCEINETMHALIEIKNLKAIKAVSFEQVGTGEMSEDEIKTLVERVSALEGYSDEDKQKLALQLKDMNPIEREATLVSLEQGIKLKGTFSGQTITPKKYATVKETKVAISELIKQAKLLVNQGNHDEAILKYEEAELIALQWNLISDSKKYRQMAFDTLEEKHKLIYSTNQKEAIKLEKQGDKDAAVEKYKLAYESIQELFKMGILKYEEIGKTLKNKIISLSGEAQNKLEQYVNLTYLRKYYSYLQGMTRKVEKSKNPFLINMNHTELLVIANKLFQMGSVAHADDIKIYKNKIERNLLELSNLPEEKQTEIKIEIAELEETKEKLLALAAQLVEQNNLIQALASYRQIFEIFGKIGDYNNAIALTETMENILENTDDIEEYIQEMEKAANETSDNDEKLGHLTIAKSLAHVIYDVKKLTSLDKKFK